MVADVLAAPFGDDRVDQGDDGADGTAEQGAAGNAGRRGDGVAGQCPVQGGHERDVLKGIDDVEDVEKIEPVRAEQPGY